MIWNISDLQNSTKCINILAARRSSFRHCNFLVGVSFFVPLGLSLIAFLYLGSESLVLVYLSIFSLTYSLAEVIYIEPKLEAVASQCAGLADDFDCEVFDLPINENFRSGCSYAFISEAASSLGEAEIETLRDWYRPELGMLPRQVSAFVAQYTSTAYDQALRKSFLKLLFWAIFLVCSSILVLMVYQNLEIRQSLISSVVPFLPLLVWFLKTIAANRKLVADQEATLNSMDRQWLNIRDHSLSGMSLDIINRDNQDGLYLRRTNSALIFPKLYFVLRPRLEGRAAQNAERFVAEFNA
jgi:hypothetical protein